MCHASDPVTISSSVTSPPKEIFSPPASESPPAEGWRPMAAGVGGAGFNDPPQRLRALAPPRRDSLDVGFLSTEQVGRRKPTFLERWTQSYTPQDSPSFTTETGLAQGRQLECADHEADPLGLVVGRCHILRGLVVSGWRHHERSARSQDRVGNTTPANSGLFPDLGSGGTGSISAGSHRRSDCRSDPRCAALLARWTDLWLANWRDGISGRECSRRGYCLPDHADYRQTENRTVSRTPNTAEVSDLIEDRGLWVVLVLRINPFTSSDLVSYAAGLTRIPAWKVMAGTLLGMAPLCFVQPTSRRRSSPRFPA